MRTRTQQSKRGWQQLRGRMRTRTRDNGEGGCQLILLRNNQIIHKSGGEEDNDDDNVGKDNADDDNRGQ